MKYVVTGNEGVHGFIYYQWEVEADSKKQALAKIKALVKACELPSTPNVESKDGVRCVEVSEDICECDGLDDLAVED
jgi:hypothetical protein